jgi:nitronate monooxygenase
MKIETDFTRQFKLKYPIINAPMFLVSNEATTVASARAGILGAVPSLNWRSTEQFRTALKKIQAESNGAAFGVNIIVNKANPRVKDDLKACLNEGVPLFITSLGSPKEVIEQAHKVGAKVYCDVVNLDYAKKVQDMGADGVIAVCTGAGGHAGPISPIVLVPYLKKHLSIPVVLAGGIADGRSMAAALALGADAVQVGTRFIATTESPVDQKYKDAIINAEPEDIVMTNRISGTPAAVIRTPYIDKVGLDLNPIEKLLMSNKTTKKWMKFAIYLRGSSMLEKAATKTTWKEVWSAGQSVGLIDNIKPTGEVVEDMVRECSQVLEAAFKQVSHGASGKTKSAAAAAKA